MSSVNTLLYFDDKSVPLIEKKILLNHLRDTTHEEINSKSNKLLKHYELKCYKKLIHRRKKGEPIAYIINKKEFWKDSFFVDSSVLIPRPDSEIIIETAIKYFPNLNENLKIIDLGSGSGCLIISLLREFKNSEGIGIDINEKAIEVAAYNKKNLLNEKRLNFYHSDFSKYNTNKYDVVVCNPPYISTLLKGKLIKDVENFEPESALFAKEDGLSCYKMILKNLIKYENKKQLVLFELGYNQLESLNKLLKNSNFKVISVEKDIANIPRCVVAKRK